MHPSRGVDAVPVVYATSGDFVGVPVDRVKPKSTTRLQRERNLEADPRAALLIEHWDREDWSRLWWVRAELRREDDDSRAAELAGRAEDRRTFRLTDEHGLRESPAQVGNPLPMEVGYLSRREEWIDSESAEYERCGRKVSELWKIGVADWANERTRGRIWQSRFAKEVGRVDTNIDKLQTGALGRPNRRHVVPWDAQYDMLVALCPCLFQQGVEIVPERGRTLKWRCGFLVRRQRDRAHSRAKERRVPCKSSEFRPTDSNNGRRRQR